MEKVFGGQTQLRFVAGAAAIAMLGIALTIRFAPAYAKTPAEVPQNQDVTSLTIADSDNDGIPDWQESLLGTNPADPKSVPTTTAIAAVTSANGTTSITTQFARSLLYQYLNNSRGGTQDISNPSAIGASLAASLNVPAPSYTTLTASEVSTVTPTQSTRAEYQTALEKALTPIQHLDEPELATYSRLIDGGDLAMRDFENLVSLYKKASSNARALKVPSDAVNVHISAINALSYYSASLAQLLEYRDDPIGSLTAIRAYNDAEQKMQTSFDALRAYFAAHQ